MIDLAEVEKEELEDTIALLASRRAFAGEYFGENTGYIRALDIAAAAVFRQYAKKPRKEDFYVCPDCGTVVSTGKYCPNCGQKIDWGEEE